jgi:uncharacterized protein (TIGR03435 family)
MAAASSVIIRTAILCAMAWGAGYAQLPDANPKFEVASVRPSPPPDPVRGMLVRMDGGPGTNDPTRLITENVDLSGLVTIAWGVEHYQLSAPDWLSNERFDVVAKVPEGATKEQFRLMLQDLLRERFKLAVHRAQKEMQAWELTVLKNGPKLTESGGVPDQSPAAFPPGPPKLDPDGFPAIPAGRSPYMAVMYDRARWRAVSMSMGEFATRLAVQVGKPVMDATGLKGKYDFTLSWVTEQLRTQTDDSNAAGPDLFRALQEQLGLKLDAKKSSVEMLVVDHIERVPTGN